MLNEQQLQNELEETKEVPNEQNVQITLENLDNSLDEINFNDEFKKRLIENNFDLMNGHTIKVTTDKDAIPKYFVPIENLEGMK